MLYFRYVAKTFGLNFTGTEHFEVQNSRYHIREPRCYARIICGCGQIVRDFLFCEIPCKKYIKHGPGKKNECDLWSSKKKCNHDSSNLYKRHPEHKKYLVGSIFKCSYKSLYFCHQTSGERISKKFIRMIGEFYKCKIHQIFHCL